MAKAFGRLLVGLLLITVALVGAVATYRWYVDGTVDYLNDLQPTATTTSTVPG